MTKPLTLEAVKEIRRLYTIGTHTPKDLASQFQRSTGRIRKIIRNELYKDPLYQPPPKQIQGSLSHLNPQEKFLHKALQKRKNRARRKGIPTDLNLSIEDLQPYPTHCPIFNLPLAYEAQGHGSDDTASIDRKNPKLGYTKGNVIIISWKANRLKGDGTAQDHELIAKWMKEDSLYI